MDPKEWLMYEEKCVQERPPACVTACPIHMDARGFLAQMKSGNVNKAFAIYSKSVPFARIVGRICDGPCQVACKRGEVGEPIAIAALEKVCVEASTAAPAKVSQAVKKDQRIAVIGGGLSGLTAAFDLARKGYTVTVVEATQQLGGRLWQVPEDRLPRRFMEDEFGVFDPLGVEIQFRTCVDDALALDEVQRTFDAVYLAVGKPAGNFGLEQDAEGNPSVDATTFATSREGVFAGGGFRGGPTANSFISSISDGRRAAVSIDRFLQKVSLTAVREDEGPYETRLYTSVEGVEPLSAVIPEDLTRGFSLHEAIQEASRCMDCGCLECVKNCEFLAHYKSYPKKYARQINQNLRIVMGIHGANTMINSCSLCGLCKEVCPTDFDMSKLIREARTEMVAKGKMPPSAHDFPLAEMDFSNSEQCALALNQLGYGTSNYVFFPGCQLSGSQPGHVERVYTYLLEKVQGGVGLINRCCGAPVDRAGQTELFKKGLLEIRGQWVEMGKPKFIVACSSCYQVFKNNLPEINVVSLWELYDQFGLPASSAKERGRVVAVHDACTTRYEPQIHHSVRSILLNLRFDVEELPNNRERTECCGSGGLMNYANPELSRATTLRRIGQSKEDFVAYCAVCRDTFAAQGKTTHHILDLIYGEAAPDSSAKRGPDFTQRRNNQVRLKTRLLNRFWGEKVEMKEEPHQAIQLMMSAETGRMMEERLIRYEDVQRVIEDAERTGSKVLNRHNGHILASYKSAHVTYWVEYTPEGQGFLVHNAYSHRMALE